MEAIIIQPSVFKLIVNDPLNFERKHILHLQIFIWQFYGQSMHFISMYFTYFT